MNRATIESNGPVMENLCRIEISDDHDSETIHLDNADVEAAREEGAEALLQLITDNTGRGFDILKAAAANGSPIHLDGEEIDSRTLSAVFEQGSAPTA